MSADLVAFVDSNVLVYAVSNDESEKQRRARENEALHLPYQRSLSRFWSVSHIWIEPARGSDPSSI